MSHQRAVTISDDDSDSSTDDEEIQPAMAAEGGGASYARGYNAAFFHTAAKHKFKFSGSGSSCRVNIFRKDVGEWLLRADKAHPGHVPYSHININSRLTGRPDPHIRIPSGMPETLRRGAKGLQKVNKVMKVVGPALDAASLAHSGYQDYKTGTTRNTTTTAAGIAGGWGGGFAGASAGAVAGSLLGPVGSLVGGIVGAVVGGVGGSITGEAVVDAIADEQGYDMEERVCKKCKRRFKIRRYKGENFKRRSACRKRKQTKSDLKQN